jgi:putative ABC transport system permease protein
MHSILADMSQDMWQAVRSLRADPRFALVVVGTLALGVAINTAMFTLVNDIVLRPLPFPQAERLVSLSESNSSRGWAAAPVSVPAFEDWQSRSRTVRPMAAVRASATMITDPSGGEVVQGALASTSLFRLLGAEPVLGRGFGEDEDRAGAPCAVMLSRRYWVTRFGSDPALIGKSLSIDDRACTVIGVVADVRLPDVGAPSVWLPFGVGLDRWRQQGIARNRNQRFLTVFGRLSPGATLDQARAEMSALAAQLASSYPNSNEGYGIAIVPRADRVLGGTRPALLMLFGAVGLILLIGCANVANLLLARGTLRQHEFALRLALGAGRARLARQLLAENLVFALIASACGLALAYWLIRLLSLVAPNSLPRLESVSLDSTAAAFALLVSTLAALASGLMPVMSAIRIAARQSLNHGDRGATGGTRARRIREGLMAAEIALAVILLTGGMLALERYWTLSHVRLGFAPHDVLTATITFPSEMDAKQRVVAFEESMRAVAALPGVESVGATQVPPLINSEWQASFAIVGRPSPSTPLAVSFARVAGPYFHTMRIPLLKGRYFDEQDDVAGRTTVIVNEAFARLFFPEGSALGARIRLQDSDTPYEIVGIVGNTIQRQLEPILHPLLYVPYSQAPGGSRMTLVVRTDGEDLGLRTAIRRSVSVAMGPRSIARIGSMDELIEAALTPHRYPALLLGLFAALALMLACVGVYGVVAYATAQRTREMGIRIALGARPSSVIAAAMRQAMWAIGGGVIAGVLGALWLARVMSSFMYDSGTGDALVFVAVPLILMCVAALAAYVPARRASRIDPLVALRSQ